MEENKHIEFTEEMKKDYTILIPTMLPTHFKMITAILNSSGYKTEVLENKGQAIIDTGLKYVHNDACYPATVVIGQLISAVQSGKYDVNKVALMITQTGGGCRASNYIFMLRKALKKAGYENIPVISINFSGLDGKSAFKLTLPMINKILYAILFGDLIMTLRNQSKPYEINVGDTDIFEDKWTKDLSNYFQNSKKINYNEIKQKYDEIIKDFALIPIDNKPRVKVGIVGEIFVKFSPLGNNDLEDFLISENTEVSMSGLYDFCMYCIYNGIIDTKLYGINKGKAFISKILYKYLIKKQKDMINIIKKYERFKAPTSFDHTRHLTRGYIGLGAKMGEGWLLTAEMLELIESGVKNIVCAQPFGCLPNHIVGKGMMKIIKEKHPDVNIVAVDYDSGATKINQENRIKLMLANAHEQINEKNEDYNIKEIIKNEQKIKIGM